MSIEHVAHYLLSIEEPSLFQEQGNPGSEQYRLVVVPDFNPPRLVRIDLSGRTGQVFVKWPEAMELVALDEGSPVGAYEPEYGPLVMNMRIELSATHRARLQQLLAALRVWELPPEKPTKWVDMYLDGSLWVLEVLVDGRYRAIFRDSPDYPSNCNPRERAAFYDRVLRKDPARTGWFPPSLTELQDHFEGQKRLASFASDLIDLLAIDHWKLAPCPQGSTR